MSLGGRFGTFLFGASEFLRRLVGGARVVSCVGDPASHPGSIISSNQDGTLELSGEEVAVAGALFSCNIEGHGVTPIYPIIKKTLHNGKLLITSGAVSGCGAKINSPDRRCYAG